MDDETIIWIKSLGMLLVKNGMIQKPDLIAEIETYRSLDPNDIDFQATIDQMVNQVNRW